MRFKEEFMKELIKRIKENMDLIESSFNISQKNLIKNRLINISPEEHHSAILIEDNPYSFLNKIVYTIINKQKVQVYTNDISCLLLLELINLILDEFAVERIESIG